MMNKRNFKKSIIIAFVAIFVFCNTFSFVPSIKSAATDLTMENIPGLPEGSTAESLLQAIRYILLGSGIRRSGYSTSANIGDFYQVFYDVENENEFVLLDSVYQQYKSTYDNENRYRFMDTLSMSAYTEYMTEYEEVNGEFEPVHVPTSEELNNTANILTYLIDTGIAKFKDGIVYLKNNVVNQLGEWISDNADTLAEGLENFAFSQVQLPYFDAYQFSSNAGTLNDLTLFTFGALHDYVWDLPIQTMAYNNGNSVLASAYCEAINNFTEMEGFNVNHDAFIFYANNNILRIWTIPESSVIFYCGNSSTIYNVFDHYSLVSTLYKFHYSDLYLLNANDCHYNTTFYWNSINQYQNPRNTVWQYDLTNSSNGWVKNTNYDVWNPIMSGANIWYFNFYNLNSVVGWKISSAYQGGFYDLSAMNITITGSDWHKSYLLDNVKLQMYTGVNVIGQEGISSLSNSIDNTLDNPVLDDTKADIPVDITKINEVSDNFENSGVSEAWADIYNGVFSDLSDRVADMIYKVSGIYQLVAGLSGVLSSTNSVVNNIKSGVDDIEDTIRTEIQGAVTDQETGDNLLGYLKVIPDISDALTGVDENDQEYSFIERIAAGVNTMVGSLTWENEDEETETVGGILINIRDYLQNMTATGVIDDNVIDGDGYENEAEKDEDYAAIIDIPIVSDIAGNTRSGSSIQKLLMIPLLFIFILLMILWILLKCLALVAMLFRTPISFEFLPTNLIAGINWLKTTYISKPATAVLSMENTTAVTGGGLFSSISIWNLLIFCVDFIVLFAVIKVLKRWADRQRGTA